MTWVLVTLVLVAVGASYLVTTVRAIGRDRDERGHYRLSAKFWLGLAGFGVLSVIALGRPLLEHALAGAAGTAGVPSTDAVLLSAGLIAVLPSVVVAAGLRNAWVLLRALRRRQRALDSSGSVSARVVSRSRWPLGQDLMAFVVEADVPDAQPPSEMAYRARRPDRTVRHRFIETCPGDHWARFEPGAAVTLRYDPGDLRAYAVLLFG